MSKSYVVGKDMVEGVGISPTSKFVEKPVVKRPKRVKPSQILNNADPVKVEKMHNMSSALRSTPLNSKVVEEKLSAGITPIILISANAKELEFESSLVLTLAKDGKTIELDQVIPFLEGLKDVKEDVPFVIVDEEASAKQVEGVVGFLSLLNRFDVIVYGSGSVTAKLGKVRDLVTVMSHSQMGELLSSLAFASAQAASKESTSSSNTMDEAHALNDEKDLIKVKSLADVELEDSIAGFD